MFDAAETVEVERSSSTDLAPWRVTAEAAVDRLIAAGSPKPEIVKHIVEGVRFAAPWLGEIYQREMLTAVATAFVETRIAKTSDGGGGQSERATRSQTAPAPSETRSTGRNGVVSQASDVGRAKRGGGHTVVEDRKVDASPARPSPAARAAALKARQATAQTILDSYTLRSGQVLGDVAFCEIGDLVTANRREARLLEMIRDIGANVPGNALVRDIVKARDVEAFLQAIDAEAKPSSGERLIEAAKEMRAEIGGRP